MVIDLLGPSLEEHLFNGFDISNFPTPNISGLDTSPTELC